MSKVGEQVCDAFEQICKADAQWIKDRNYDEVRELLISAIETLCQFDGLTSNYQKGLDWLENSPSLRGHEDQLASAKYHYLHGAVLDLLTQARILDMFEDYRREYDGHK
jgi:hypothetical protein